MKPAPALVVVSILLAVASCARRGGPALQPAVPGVDEPRPAVRGGDNGLELQVWVVADAGHAVARGLRPYLDRAVPIDPAALERWRGSGLRVVAVPAGEIELLRAEWTLVAPLNVQWLGQMPEWSSLVVSPPLPEGAVVRLDTGSITLPAGRLRLLARCWTVPGASPGGRARLGLELVPEFRDAAAPDHLGDIMPLEGEESARGVMFMRLGVSALVPEGDAYLVVPETPETDWRRLAAPDRAEAAPDPQADPIRGDTSGDVFRPAPSLGEVLLTGARGEDRVVGVLVLVPRVPEDVRLLER